MTSSRSHVSAKCELTYPKRIPSFERHVLLDNPETRLRAVIITHHHHQMPRRVQDSDSEEEEGQPSSAVRKSQRATDESRNPPNPGETNGVPDSEEEAEESPKARKRARANTGGDSHQVKDESEGSLRSGTLIRDTDG
jgi:hypothetical protein